MAPTIDELLDAVAQAPGDLTLAALCADALLEAHEPQGELMSAHLASVNAGRLEGELEQRVKRVIGLGAIPEHDFKLTWSRGFVHALEVRGLHGFKVIETWWRRYIELITSPVELLTDPVSLRVARLLRCVRELSIAPFEINTNYAPLWSLFAELPLPPSVRTFNADQFASPLFDNHQITWAHLSSLEQAWPAFEQLENLRLRGSYVDLPGLRLPRLKSFEVMSSTLTPHNVAQVRAAHWPALERLSLAFGDDSYNETPVMPEDLAPLLRELPKTVRHLGLRNLPCTKELIPMLAASAVLQQLTEVDLSLGVLYDGAAMLEQHAKAFAHLKVLDVTDTGLAEHQALKRHIPGLVARGETKVYRYVSVSE